MLRTFPRLAERIHQLGARLSGGEQQMLSIGRALMTHPDLVILDEATEGRAPLIDEIKRGGMAVLIVDHDWHRVLSRSDRACVLQKGQVVLQGKAEDLLGDRKLPEFLGV